MSGRRQDTLALAVFGAGALLIAVIAFYLVFAIRSQPEAPATASFTQQVRDAVGKLGGDLRR